MEAVVERRSKEGEIRQKYESDCRVDRQIGCLFTANSHSPVTERLFPLADQTLHCFASDGIILFIFF